MNLQFAKQPSYWSPYLAGLAIGLTLILTYYVMGHGVGASGAYTQLAARMLEIEAPAHAQANVYLKRYLELGTLKPMSISSAISSSGRFCRAGS
ncbi:MAG: hypothetical protein HYS67_07990 [Deltaproteobacteria bacterium]|nr:hypothetical protein [Deltaproteobacteria bacterium]